MTPLALSMIILPIYWVNFQCGVDLSCSASPDPRNVGSQNPEPPMYCASAQKAAVAVLLCDMLKGTIPVWGGYFLNIEPFMLGLVAIAACLGHMYPIFFHFKGGKGVATALGAIAPIGLDLTAMVMATWLVVVVLFRYSSLAALVTVLLAPLYTWLIKPQYTLPVAMLCCLIVLRHHQNVKRLFAGTEPKVGEKNKKPSDDEESRVV